MLMCINLQVIVSECFFLEQFFLHMHLTQVSFQLQSMSNGVSERLPRVGQYIQYTGSLR